MTTNPYSSYFDDADVWTCSNCDTSNGFHYAYCTNCGNPKPLDEEEVISLGDPDDI